MLVKFCAWKGGWQDPHFTADAPLGLLLSSTLTSSGFLRTAGSFVWKCKWEWRATPLWDRNNHFYHLAQERLQSLPWRTKVNHGGQRDFAWSHRPICKAALYLSDNSNLPNNCWKLKTRGSPWKLGPFYIWVGLVFGPNVLRVPFIGWLGFCSPKGEERE